MVNASPEEQHSSSIIHSDDARMEWWWIRVMIQVCQLRVKRTSVGSSCATLF
jgi:hypothetical protein